MHRCGHLWWVSWGQRRSMMHKLKLKLCAKPPTRKTTSVSPFFSHLLHWSCSVPVKWRQLCKCIVLGSKWRRRAEPKQRPARRKRSPRTDEKWRVVNQIRKTVRGIGISTRFVPSKRVSDYLKLILLSGLFIMGYEDMKMSRLVELSIS